MNTLVAGLKEGTTRTRTDQFLIPNLSHMSEETIRQEGWADGLTEHCLKEQAWQRAGNRHAKRYSEEAQKDFYMELNKLRNDGNGKEHLIRTD